jgi:hypothetical protein
LNDWKLNGSKKKGGDNLEDLQKELEELEKQNDYLNSIIEKLKLDNEEQAVNLSMLQSKLNLLVNDMGLSSDI